MPTTLEFDHSRKVGIAHYRGEITDQDLLEYVESWSDAKFMDYDEFVFIHDDAHVPIGSLLFHADNLEPIDHHFVDGLRTAIVENPESDFSFGQFWASAYNLKYPEKREVRVFDSEKKARNWLFGQR